MAMGSFTTDAQTNTVGTGDSPALNLGGFNININSHATNWVAIPYFKYDLKNHESGYGGALLYRVSPNFYTGARFDQMHGQQTTAGVQAQLQTTVTVAGFKATPFLETSVGLGSSALYGSTGPGMFINLYAHDFGQRQLNLGLIGDYEHVVNGTDSYNCVNVGALLNFSF